MSIHWSSTKCQESLPAVTCGKYAGSFQKGRLGETRGETFCKDSGWGKSWQFRPPIHSDDSEWSSVDSLSLATNVNNLSPASISQRWLSTIGQQLQHITWHSPWLVGCGANFLSLSDHVFETDQTVLSCTTLQCWQSRCVSSLIVSCDQTHFLTNVAQVFARTPWLWKLGICSWNPTCSNLQLRRANPSPRNWALASQLLGRYPSHQAARAWNLIETSACQMVPAVAIWRSMEVHEPTSHMS